MTLKEAVTNLLAQAGGITKYILVYEDPIDLAHVVMGMSAKKKKALKLLHSVHLVLGNKATVKHDGQ